MIRYEWRPATVLRSERAAENMISLYLRPDTWVPHLPGQHYEIRFPGEELSRKFSIASDPEASAALEFGIQVLDYGLLTPRLSATQSGDALEVRGPTGTGFTWSVTDGGPLILLGAGAGITPLLSMYEHHRLSGVDTPIVSLLSARTPERVYRLERLRAAMTIRFTETGPRLDRDTLAPAVEPLLGNPRTAARICGPKGFRGAMVDALLELGLSEDQVRSEAFT